MKYTKKKVNRVTIQSNDEAYAVFENEVTVHFLRSPVDIGTFKAATQLEKEAGRHGIESCLGPSRVLYYLVS